MTNMVTPRCRPLGDPWRLKHNGHPSVPVVADGDKDVAAASVVLAPRADRQRPDNGLRLRPRITPANAWFPKSRTWPVTSTAPVPTLTGPYHEHPVPALRPPPLDPRPR